MHSSVLFVESLFVLVTLWCSTNGSIFTQKTLEKVLPEIMKKLQEFSRGLKGSPVKGKHVLFD